MFWGFIYNIKNQYNLGKEKNEDECILVIGNNKITLEDSFREESFVIKWRVLEENYLVLLILFIRM